MKNCSAVDDSIEYDYTLVIDKQSRAYHKSIYINENERYKQEHKEERTQDRQKN